MTMTDDRLAIGNVARRTGLQADLIRAWERRYGAIEPERDRNQRRLYSEDDVTRLVLLRRLVEAGHSIGRVAELDDDE
ncbi:MAG: MerR family transcriptional regulator, partial [Acidobacteriota bacterium]